MTKSNENLSGPGPKILLSAGAENFDPDSMVETPEEQKEVARALAPSILSLFLRPSGDEAEPFQVAGFIKNLSGSSGVLNLEFHCLASIAADLAAFVFLAEPTFLSSAEVNMGKSAFKWEFENYVLKSVNVEFVSEGTASVQVSFCKT